MVYESSLKADCANCPLKTYYASGEYSDQHCLPNATRPKRRVILTGKTLKPLMRCCSLGLKAEKVSTGKSPISLWHRRQYPSLPLFSHVMQTKKP